MLQCPRCTAMLEGQHRTVTNHLSRLPGVTAAGGIWALKGPACTSRCHTCTGGEGTCLMHVFCKHVQPWQKHRMRGSLGIEEGT